MLLIDSLNLAAAFPVGAARKILKFSSLPACSNKSARIFATVVVLPVPGPPEITLNFLKAEVIAAIFCQLISPSILSGKSLFRLSFISDKFKPLISSLVRSFIESESFFSYSQ